MERLLVLKETKTGLNKTFLDTKTGETISRGELADRIEQGDYPKMHIMKMKKGKRTIRIPRSNPDRNSKNNLG